MERSRLAAAQAAANQRIEQSRPGAAGSEEFWAKLEEMKLKYKGSLKELYPYMSTIANGQRPEKKDQFKKHVKDCFQILELSRGNQVPPTLSTALLEKACKFIDSVIDVIKTYILKERTWHLCSARVQRFQQVLLSSAHLSWSCTKKLSRLTAAHKNNCRKCALAHIKNSKWDGEMESYLIRRGLTWMFQMVRLTASLTIS
eukprot:IDg12941t1